MLLFVRAGLTRIREGLGSLLRPRFNVAFRSADVLPDIAGHDPIKGNHYTTAEQVVLALYDKYQGLAKWGGEFAEAIVDYKAGKVLSPGLRAQLSAAAKLAVRSRGGSRQPEEVFGPELDYARAVLQAHGLAGGALHDWGVMAQLEGRVLAQLSLFQGGDPVPRLELLPWKDLRYQVDTRADVVTWDVLEGGRRTKVEIDNTSMMVYTDGEPMVDAEFNVSPSGRMLAAYGFSYLPFNAVPGSDEGWPALTNTLPLLDTASVLRALIQVGLRNWAIPTPVIEGLKSMQDVESTIAWARKNKWRPGRSMLATIGAFFLKGPDTGGFQTVGEHYINTIKAIAGSADTPAHVLGHADLAPTRSVGEDIRLSQDITATSEGQVWFSRINQHIDRCMRMSNAVNGTDLQPGVVEVTLAGANKSTMRAVTEMYFPAFDKGLIDAQTMLEKLPGVDPDVVKARLDEIAKGEGQRGRVLDLVGFMDRAVLLIEAVVQRRIPKAAAIALFRANTQAPDDLIAEVWAHVPDEQPMSPEEQAQLKLSAGSRASTAQET